MIPQSASRFNWKMPLGGVLAAGIAHLPGMIYGNDLIAFLVTGVLLV